MNNLGVQFYLEPALDNCASSTTRILTTFLIQYTDSHNVYKVPPYSGGVYLLFAELHCHC